ncbi:response regulator transcription factor [Paenibacillus sp. strain BS8-2]
MWRVLIVEDEPFFRRTLKLKTPWKAMGFEVVGEAGDGNEALQRIYELKPDVVISNIIMPCMNGIDLLRRTREAGIDCRFVMLTCSTEFEYAREALQLGASGYMLKLSLDNESLSKTLDRVKLELQTKAQMKLQQESSLFHVLYKEVWNHIRHMPDQPFEMSRTDHLSWVQIIVSYTNKPIREMLGAMGTLLQPGTVVHEDQHNGITTMMVWSHSPVACNTENYKSLLGAAVITAAGEGNRLYELWYKALLELSAYWYGLEEAPRGTASLAAETDFTQEQHRELLRAIQRMEAGELRIWIHTLLQQWRSASIPVWGVMENCHDILKAACRLANMKAFGVEMIYSCTDYTQLKSMMVERLLSVMEKYKSNQQQVTDHAGINQIVRYIHAHYNASITLRAMAILVSMDEYYLSGLFTQKMGEPLIQYLQRVRVRKAKELLTESELAIATIGEMAGFVNTNYFFKTFKKWTTQTPNEYRKDSKRSRF